MKITYRIPTEMYGFAEIELNEEDIETGTDPENLEGIYNQYVKAFKPKPINSIPDKEFNQFLDNMLLGDNNHVEQYEKCSPQQIDIIQAVKRSLKRIKAREDKLTI